ncbi:hypothetical protein ES705_36805 [subsurface metagenome]
MLFRSFPAQALGFIGIKIREEKPDAAEVHRQPVRPPEGGLADICIDCRINGFYNPGEEPQFVAILSCYPQGFCENREESGSLFFKI